MFHNYVSQEHSQGILNETSVVSLLLLLLLLLLYCTISNSWSVFQPSSPRFPESPYNKQHFNPITYGILRSYLQGGGVGFLTLVLKRRLWLTDLKFGTNNGIDNTNNFAKFELIDFSTFRDMTSQKPISIRG